MKNLFIAFIILFFAFSYLSAGWGEDLCEDQTCSGHGECQDDGENEWCACDDGYIADGMECILGCNGVTCSGHGSCSVVSGAEVCTCEAGFYASGLNCILNEASTVDTLAILNSTDCYNTGNCHYRLIFATGAYDFTPALSSLYDIIINVLDSENVWHNYRKTVAQCVAESVCDNVDAQYIDFWFQHNVNGNQYVTVEILGNGDNASDDMYHDVLIDYCYGVNCGTGGTCDGTSGYPVCSCEEGYVLRGGICEEGWFEDENLAAAVVELLQNKGYDVETETDIEPEMLEDITHLPLRGKNISSLAGIELFSSLSVLDVSENNISNLSHLADCSGLKVLNISSNPVNDLSPLGGLPIFSLDISYSGVYNLNPLASNADLIELILSDTENGRYTVIRPENGSIVSEWLSEQQFTGCNTINKFGNQGQKYGEIGKGGGCPAHGSCVDGICVCDSGYAYSLTENTCFNPNLCDSGYHQNPDTGICEKDTQKFFCGLNLDKGKIFPNSYLEWNGSEYEIPTGHTTEWCYVEEPGCANSICQWNCKTGYTRVQNVCVPYNKTVREIQNSAYNQFILPNISRQDAVLEPVPGIPSFAPLMKAGIYYDANDHLVTGWHFDLPRVELLSRQKCSILCAENWDQKTLYVYMPWGKEEYSIQTEIKCFNADNSPASCEIPADFSNAARLEITYYPTPGQNVFSYIVLETTGDAYHSFAGSLGQALSNSEDSWKITRYGEDGSVTEFERKEARRPATYRFMDYIPISKHITRDQKETSFGYEWEMVLKRKIYSYYSLRSATIIDPLKRVVKITANPVDEIPEYGLMGKPDNEYKAIYEPLFGTVEISTGKVGFNNELNLKTAVKYQNIDGFSMDAEIYKNGSPYRKDSYSIKNGVFSLESYPLIIPTPPVYAADPIGQTTWEFTKYENSNVPNGYIERKLVDDNEYIVKQVTGEFAPALQEPVSKTYSLSGSSYKTVSVYYQVKNESYSSKRIIEDYFTDWLQPSKRVICEYNTSESCDNDPDKVTEEIKYNVSGSPIYFRNADGQVRVNLYNTTGNETDSNYTIHFYTIPALGTYTNFNQNLGLDQNIFRSDSLHEFGTLACSSVYSLDASDNIRTMLLEYIAYGIGYNSDWCSNSNNSRVTNYEWGYKALGEPHDVSEITYPDGKTRSFTYDYNITNGGVGKVRGETITGSNNQNSLQTCYEYNENYQLIAQGIGTPSSCDPKKGFAFGGEGGLLMTSDYSFDENNSHVLENNYIYDYLGRKIAERNSAGISTVYVYDGLDRVVFKFFGCNVAESVFGNIYEPYNFDGDDSAGENGTGVTFTGSVSGLTYLSYANPNYCEYYRKYKYDEMSNLTETYFFEYWGVNSDNQIVKNASSPKIIKQETKYDMLGRAVESCQYDGAISKPTDYDKRCIETEHDAFGNITGKTENGEERVITYDLRNRPLTVTVDELPTEQYSYSNAAAGGYFGYDSIKNKYDNINPLTTYKDKWGRAAKSVDPFGNETETTYESDYSDNITSQTTTSSGTKTTETAWTYDDLDRKLSETRKQFIPGSESTTNVNHVTYWDYDSIGNVISVESSDGTKQTYSYDTLNRPVETVNYEKINSNDVVTSYSENSYDTNGRLFRTKTTKNAQTITEDYGFDTFGRVTAVKTTDPENSSRYRVKFYNTGGQVIWEADEESNRYPTNAFSDLGLGNVEVGNQKYYTYNAFGDLEKTVYVMTNTGIGLDETPDPNPWLNNSQITTNFTYDIFGRITSRTNDRSGVTEYSYYPNNTTGSHRRNKLQSIQISPAVDNNSNYTDKTQTYTYTYDEYGDEASVEYTEGNSYSMEVDFTRDAYGRITSKTSDGSVPVIQTFTYNMRNLLETATDTVGNAAATSVTRLYDSFGNPYSESVSSGNVTKTVSRRMTDAKTYQFTYPDGKTLRKTATGNDLDSIEYNNSEIASYSRANGVLTAVTKGQNLIETFSYNSWNMLDNHNIKKSQTDVYDMSYNYSRGWHLTEKADGIKNTSDKYSYDSYYRLKEVKYDFANNTPARTDSFYQDGVHNIEQSTENGTTFAWGVDKLNRLREKKVGNNTEVAYGYDERNNMISEDRSGTTNDKTYIYDDLNRLIEVKDGSQNTIAEYTYDAFNRRITKIVGTTTERYSYDDWDIVEISTSSNDYVNIIDSGTDRHIAIEVTSNNTSTLYYFLTDERGNVTALTDANGNVLERYRYRVYGDFEILDAQFTPKNCNNQTCYATNLHNFLWGGSLYEPETGLYWMRNRYYHIDMHRFINQDPIGIWGDANNLGNGFAYVAGMVIEASDPTGLDVTVIGSDKLIDAVANAAQSETFANLYNSLDIDRSVSVNIQSIDMPEKDKQEQGGSYCDKGPDGTGSIVIYIDNEIVENGGKTTRKRGYVSLEAIIAHELSHANDKRNGLDPDDIDEIGKKRNEDHAIETEWKVDKELDAKKAAEEAERKKKEEEERKREEQKNKGGEKYPSDPDNSNDSFQQKLMESMLSKILRDSDFSIYDQGPVVKIQVETVSGNPKWVFVFNPFYRGKDPMKEILWETRNADGTKGFARNPFAPKGEYGYDATTYEKFQQAGFQQTNVDPYWH